MMFTGNINISKQFSEAFGQNKTGICTKHLNIKSLWNLFQGH